MEKNFKTYKMLKKIIHRNASGKNTPPNTPPIKNKTPESVDYQGFARTHRGRKRIDFIEKQNTINLNLSQNSSTYLPSSPLILLIQKQLLPH